MLLIKDTDMTRTLSRLALGLSIALSGLGPMAMAQTTTTAPAADATAAPADPAAAAGVSLGVPDGMPSQAQAAVGAVYLAAKFDAWEQRCVKTADGADPCQLYQLLKDEAGNPTAEVSFFTLPDGSQAVLGATVLVPLETLLTANLKIAVDQNVALVYPYSYCTVSGCLAKTGFTADDLTSLKKGTNANVIIIPAAAPDKTVTVTISLKGFSAGYQAIKDAADKIKK